MWSPVPPSSYFFVVWSRVFLERVQFESVRFGCPAFADELIGREAFERFQPSTKIICIDEVGEMSSKLVVAIVMIAFDGGFLDRAVHSLDLAIGPRMIDFCEAMLDAVFAASHVEDVRHVAGGWAIGVARREAELDAVVRQDRVNLVRNGGDQRDQEGEGGHTVGALDQLHKREFARAIDGDEQIEFAFGRLHFDDVDVKEVYRIRFELLLRWSVARNLGRPADPVPLQATMPSNDAMTSASGAGSSLARRKGDHQAAAAYADGRRRRSPRPRRKELSILEIRDRSANRRPTIAASTWRRPSG